MPLNVKVIFSSILLVPVCLGLSVSAQETPQSSPTASPSPQQVLTPVRTPTSAEIMRGRISTSKAFIAVRNYNAAIYELENIRRETNDPSVLAVTNVLLINSYLEQGDYKRAQDFLNSAYTALKANKPNSPEYYHSIAGQIVKGSRMKAERYRALGLSVTDKSLPLEALNDLERMRETLEIVITQARETGKDKAKADTAMALLEEAANSRGALARDDYDARRWREEAADSREQIVSSRSVIANAVSFPESDAVPEIVAEKAPEPQNTQTTAAAIKQPDPLPEQKPLPVKTPEAVASASVPAPTPKVETSKPRSDTIVVSSASRAETTAEKKADEAKPAEKKPQGPLEVGSLIAYATEQSAPVYPPQARAMRTTGVVKVEVTINETGEVTTIQKVSGPTLLQGAARDAVRKWRFKPFVLDGEPVKANGFVSFNFSL